VIPQPLHGESRSDDVTSSDHIHFSRLVFIRYLDNGSVKSGSISIKIEFSPSGLGINYRDVEYSDKQLQQVVENNPHALRNIDSYLRNKFLKLEYNL
jgi:hypothetical protein